MGGNYEMTYVGHNHFSAKDRSKIYYVLQVLCNTVDEFRGTNIATLINIFVDDETYKRYKDNAIGTTLNIEVKPNLSTGKINYKIVK